MFQSRRIHWVKRCLEQDLSAPAERFSKRRMSRLQPTSAGGTASAILRAVNAGSIFTGAIAGVVAITVAFTVAIVIHRTAAGPAAQSPLVGGDVPARDMSLVLPATNSANAADCYLQAMKLWREMPASKTRQLSRYKSGAFDSQAEAFFRDENQIVGWVRRGASLGNCDWGQSELQDRMNALNGLRGINDITLAHGRYALRQNDAATSLEDGLASVALGRHIGTNHLAVDEQVEIGIEWGRSTVAASLPSLLPEQLKSLPRRLDALPPRSTGTQLLQGEFDMAVKRSSEQGATAQILVNGLQPFFKAFSAS